MNETKTLDLTQFESQDKDKTPNVKKLWSPEVEQETDKLPFDPERDITGKDWEEIKHYFQTTEDMESWFELVSTFNKIKNSHNKINIDFDQVINEKMLVKMQEFKKTGNWDNFLIKAVIAKNLDSRIDIGLDKKIIKKIKKDAMSSPFRPPPGSEIYGHWTQIRMVANIKILDSEIKPEDFGINETTWRGLDKLLKELLKPDRINLIGYCNILSYMRILDPQINIQLYLNENIWEKITDVLNNYRKNKDWGLFAMLAENLILLVAQKIEITDKGLKITMPEKKPQITNKIPLPTKLNLN